MKYWSKDELYRIEETLLDRKYAIKHLKDEKISHIKWRYEDWEDDLIEQCAKMGYPIGQLENFLHRSQGDIQHHIRKLGYQNWNSYREAVQLAQREQPARITKVSYRDIVEAAIGRPMAKDELVHHINCNHDDDTVENLWVCKQANHKHAHASYRKIQRALIAEGVISFNRLTGDYEFDINAINDFAKHWLSESAEDPIPIKKSS